MTSNLDEIKSGLEELKNRWPLFSVSFDEGIIKVYRTSINSTYMTVPIEALQAPDDLKTKNSWIKYCQALQSLTTIDSIHEVAVRDKNIQENFPNLIIEHGEVYINTRNFPYTRFSFETTWFGECGSKSLISLLTNPAKGIREIVETLIILNRDAKLAVEDPDRYFWCTECSKSISREKYNSNLFIGAYCTDCEQKPTMQRLLRVTGDLPKWRNLL